MNYDSVKYFQGVIERLVLDFEIPRDFLFKDAMSQEISTRMNPLDLLAVTDNLHVEMRDFCKGNTNFMAIVNNVKTNYHGESPTYNKVGAFSKIASLNTFIEVTRGSSCHTTDYILKKLQIHPRYLEDLSNPMSVLDLKSCITMNGDKLSDSLLQEVGKQNALQYLNSPLGDIIRKEKSLVNLVESFCYHTGMIEKNWNYDCVRVSEKEVLVLSTEKESFTDEIGESSFTNSRMNQWRWSFLSSILNSVHEGGPIHCEQINSDDSKAIVSVKEYSLN